MTRSHYLDIIRGLACLQVLLLHIAEAFFPALATEKITDFTIGGLVHGSPLYLIYDGYTGVFIFFLLSGYVLTPSFNKDVPPHKQLIARWGRLIVPAFSACFLSLVIYWALGGAALTSQAAALSGSVFLKDWWQPDLNWHAFIKDSMINSVMLGYAETNALITDRYLDSIATAYVAPLWTLSVELHGSILVLMLVTLHKRHSFLYGLCLLVFCILVIRSYYILFIIGHLLALAHRDEWKVDKPSGAFIYIIAGGILCVMGEVKTFALFESVCSADLPFSLDCSGHTQKMVGSIVLFYGLLISQSAQAILKGKILQWLGTHSFPIYLVHWPILCGLGSSAAIGFNQLLPGTPILACLFAAGVTLCLTLIGARYFLHIDHIAIRFSRWLREGPKQTQLKS